MHTTTLNTSVVNQLGKQTSLAYNKSRQLQVYDKINNQEVPWAYSKQSNVIHRSSSHTTS